MLINKICDLYSSIISRSGCKCYNLCFCIIGISICSRTAYSSTDNTKKVIEDKSKQYDNVFLLPHEVNKGLCGGLNSAIGYFLKNGGKDDLMALMDGDNTHDPKYIHAMLKKLKDGKKDCVIASRYCKESASPALRITHAVTASILIR